MTIKCPKTHVQRFVLFVICLYKLSKCRMILHGVMCWPMPHKVMLHCWCRQRQTHFRECTLKIALIRSIFSTKCTKYRLAAGLRPDPLGELAALPRPPGLMAAYFYGEERGRGGRRKEGVGRQGEYASSYRDERPCTYLPLNCTSRIFSK